MKDVLSVLRSTASHVFVAPVLEGRPRPGEWPRPLRWVALLATVVIVALALLGGVGGVLRRHGELVNIDDFMIFPAWAVGVMLWVGVFNLTLLFSASLRTHWAVTVVVWLGVAPQLLLVSAAGGPLAIGLALLSMLILAVLPWVVRRRPWHVAEVAVVWLLLQLTVLLPLWLSPAQGIGLDARTLSMLNMQLAMTALAAPALAAAGYAAVEIVVTAGQWLTHDLRQLGRTTGVTRWLLLVVLLTGLWRAWTIGRTMADPPLDWSWWGLLTCAVVVVMAVAMCLGCWRASPLIHQERRAVWPVGRPATVAEIWNPWALVAGIALAAPLLPLGLVSTVAAVVRVAGAPETVQSGAEWLRESLTSASVRHGIRAVFGVALLVVAWRRARRGNASLPLLAGCVVPIWFFSLVNLAFDGQLPFWSTTQLSLLLSAAALVWLVSAALRRRLHNGVLLGVWVVWLLPQLYEFREVLSDPTTVVGRFSPLALVLLGLLWRLATDGAFVRGDSDAMPRTSRVLLLLANTCLGMMVLALTVLAGGQAPFAGIDNWPDLGQLMIGAPLLLAAMLAPFLVTAWSARVEPQPGPPAA